MKSGIKCPECNSCLDVIWIMPRRFYHCWLCKEFYDKVNNVITIIDIYQSIGIQPEVLEQMMENYYDQTK